MQQHAALENWGTGRPDALIHCRAPIQGVIVCGYSSKGGLPIVDLTSFPLGGKTQAARPVHLRYKAASGPEPVVEFGEETGKTGIAKWRGNFLLT